MSSRLGARVRECLTDTGLYLIVLALCVLVVGRLCWDRWKEWSAGR